MKKGQNILLLLFIFVTISTQQICGHSQFFSGQRCAPCATNCLCSQQNTCSSCLPGYTYDQTFQNCLQCPLASSAVNVGCSQCCYQIVETSFVCSTCPSLSNTYLLGGQCIRILGCYSIDQNGLCTGCDNGYFLKDGKCITCHASCTTCIDSTFCTSCTTGYYNGTNANYGTCAPCPLGCLTCSSSTVCSVCSQGFRLSVSTCIACSANCLQCSSTACTTCTTGYGLVSGSCYACTNPTYGGTSGCLACSVVSSVIKCSQCSDGFFLSGVGTCTSCSAAFPNSLYCTSTRPLQCLNDYSPVLASRYYLINNLCVANVNKCKVMSNSQGLCSSCYFQSGAYYQLVNSVCVACVQTGCSTFSSTCQCLTCQNGYQFINKQCIACQNLNCYTCQSDVRSCQVCAPYYGLISSACISCTQNTCLNCDGDASKCVTCLTGYYNNAGNCYRCQQSCLTCTSSTLCLSCANSYYLLTNGRCKSLPSNCVTVDSAGKCTKCAYGYQVVQNICVPCSSDLFNLKQCERFCPSYYSLLKYQGKLGILVICLFIIGVFLGY